MRVKRFIKKTGRKLYGKETVRFDMKKVECYNYHRRGHFSKECRAPRNQENRNRDAPRRNAPVDTSTDKTGLGYNGQINESEVLNNVVDSVSNSCESDGDNNQVNDRFKKSEGYHAVLPLFTRNYMPPRADLSFVGLDDSVFKSKLQSGQVSVNADKALIEQHHQLVLPGIHMIGNKSYLTDYQEIDGGFVAFGENAKGGNQTNGNAGTQAKFDKGQAEKKTSSGLQYVLLPLFTSDSQATQSDKDGQEKDVRDQEEALRKQFDQEFIRLSGQGEDDNTNSTNRLNTISSPVNTVSSSFTTINPGRKRAQRNEFKSMFGQEKDINGNNTYMMFTPVSTAGSSYVNLGGSILVNAATLPNAGSPYVNLGGSILVNAATLPNVNLLTDPLMPDLEDNANLQNTRIFSGAYDDEVEGAETDLNNLELTTVVSLIPTTRIHKDHPKEQIIRDPLSTPQTRRMTKISQEHALKDKRGLVVRNKARLVAQGYTQEEGTDYDEVFAHVARIEAIRIEAIRLFLAYASFMGFIVYQMDIKSAFMYGIIEKEVYVFQPYGFEDPQFSDKVYKVEKALYDLHQAPRAWYETLSTYLLENRFRRGIIDNTLFIKKDKGDILLVQVYVDDIIFGSTKKSLCTEFERLMHKKFQMSSMGELTFFLGLQVMQRDDRIFISQDKYVADVLQKFNFYSLKIASTPMETNKELLKDEEVKDMDRIFRYMKDQPKLGLWYFRDSPFDLEDFSDSDYAEEGEGSRHPSEPQPLPSTAQPTHEEPIPNVASSSHQKTQSPRQD
nr:putative ribonuclease H-like domain-containing protein [Tanacetum cinerariifolium]